MLKVTFFLFVENINKFNTNSSNEFKKNTKILISCLKTNTHVHEYLYLFTNKECTMPIYRTCIAKE